MNKKPQELTVKELKELLKIAENKELGPRIKGIERFWKQRARIAQLIDKLWQKSAPLFFNSKEGCPFYDSSKSAQQCDYCHYSQVHHGGRKIE